MRQLAQQEEPTDILIGTGEAHTVREFLEEAFGCAGPDYQEYVH